MTRHHNLKSGFTIVELTLACAFLGVLLMVIAFLTNHIISIYQKGLSLKSVNSVGEDLIDEFSREIAASQPVDYKSSCEKLSNNKDKCKQEKGYKLVYQQRSGGAKIKNSGTTINSVPYYGALCTGRYSYIWNTGYALGGGIYDPSSSDATATLEVGNASTGLKQYKNFRLLRVEDTEREICFSSLGGNYNNEINNRFSIKDPSVKITKILADFDNNDIYSEDNLVFYDFTIFRPAYHATTKQSFYSGTFILGTLRGGVNITAAGNFCEERPDNLNTDFAYCAMNKFNFAIRATGEKLR